MGVCRPVVAVSRQRLCGKRGDREIVPAEVREIGVLCADRADWEAT